MIGNKKSLATYGVAAGIAMAVFQFAAPAAATSYTVPGGWYNLWDHPDGALTNYTNGVGVTNNVSYGIRLDSQGGSDQFRTFSFQSAFTGEGTETSIAMLDFDVANNKATISGQVRRNSDDQRYFITYTMTDLDPTFGGDTQFGWTVPTNSGSGQLINVDDATDTISLTSTGAIPGSHEFDNDGHRCNVDNNDGETNGKIIYDAPSMCDENTLKDIVGRGWLTGSGTNDFLYVAKHDPNHQDIAEPGTLALFGLGLVGLGYARRRKTIA